MHERDEERTIIQHANGFPMIKTTMFERGHDRYVFPSQCEQVFYSNVLGKGIGHLLLDMIQEEGQLSILVYRKKMILKIKKMIR